jgi:hypothetical protein
MITTVIRKFEDYSTLGSDAMWVGTNVPTCQNTLSKGTHIFQQCSSHLKILGARMVLCSKFHAEDLQILGSTKQDLVATATSHLGFVYP